MVSKLKRLEKSDFLRDAGIYWTYNLLLGNVKLSGSIGLIITLSDPVDFVVDGSTMVITVLTSTSNRPLNVRRMPGTDTSNLSETLVRLARKLFGSPSGCDTRKSVTLCNRNNVNHLVCLKDGVNGDLLLEVTLGEVNLVGDGSTVDLDLHEVCLLLLQWRLADLGVCKNTDDSAILLNALEIAGNWRLVCLGVFLGVLGESLLLTLVPVLVEPPPDLLAQVLSPNGGERTKTTGSLDVSDNTDTDHLKKTSNLVPNPQTMFP